MRKKGDVTVEFDPARPPPLTRKQKAELKALAAKPDAEIDYSDIPETDAAFWAKANVSIPAAKAMISIRVDSDVLEWYRRHARRYQTLMNAVLRKYKEARELEETSRK